MSEAFHTKASLESPESDLLWEHHCQGIMQEGDYLIAYFPARIALPLEGYWETISDIDYVKQYFDTLEPIVLNKLIIAPTHKQISVRETQHIIWLDPGMAFGTGHHETTYMALKALEKLELKHKTVLDVGTGSGILAMAAKVLGSPGVTGIDIDPQAIKVARENAALNNLDLEFLEGTLEGQVKHSTDIIIANLFAELHIILAHHYARVLKPNGSLIITGIQNEKRARVKEAIGNLFTLTETHTKNDWTLMVGKFEN
jgi:ribosomal protein L11 methyltransferase